MEKTRTEGSEAENFYLSAMVQTCIFASKSYVGYGILCHRLNPFFVLKKIIIALIIRKIINAVTVMNAVMQFIREGIIAVTARGPYGPRRARFCLNN